MQDTRWSKTGTVTPDGLKADPGKKSQLNHNNNIYKKLQENQELDYDEN